MSNSPVMKRRIIRRSDLPAPGLLFPEMTKNPWGTSKLRQFPRKPSSNSGLTVLELCAGAGGQALGYEMAGIQHTGLVELDPHACATLRLNRPHWRVIEEDLNCFDGAAFRDVDIIAGGLPCPPFSVAGKQLGSRDDRNLFPALIRLVDQIRPKAVMIENVRGILEGIFEDYRFFIKTELSKLGYETGWKLMNASDFGVPQLRPRVVFVAIRKKWAGDFSWPEGGHIQAPAVGEVLYDLMAANGWLGAKSWSQEADVIAPTIVGGSHKHGGPDLGPTRARRAWAALGVDGLGISDSAPAAEFNGTPRLTVRMVARLQGFPDNWQFAGKKTAAYRQIGNAFPPPFARAVAGQIRKCLSASMFTRAAG